MERTPVTGSKMLASVGYDPKRQIVEVELLKRQKDDTRPVYQYSNFPPEKWAEFMSAESLGSYYLKVVVRNHPCTKVNLEKEKTEAQAAPRPEEEDTDA